MSHPTFQQIPKGFILLSQTLDILQITIFKMIIFIQFGMIPIHGIQFSRGERIYLVTESVVLSNELNLKAFSEIFWVSFQSIADRQKANVSSSVLP